MAAAAFTHEREDGGTCLTIRLLGELDITTVQSMQAALRPLRGDPAPIVIDLAGLEFAGVRGTRALAAEVAALRGARPVTIVNLPERIRRVATLVQVADELGSRPAAL